MSRKSALIPVLGVLVLALVVGVLVGWFASRTPSDPSSAATNEPVVAVTEPQVETNDSPEMVTEEPTETTATDPVEEKLGPLTNENWEDHLSEVLGAEDIDSDQKADRLATMIPKLPEPAQVEIAEHLINLVSDEEYNKKTSKLLVDPTLPKSVTDVLLTDLMNRHDGLRLPLTLEIAKNDAHPLKDEAREMLEMSLMEEFGTDWDKWKTAIDESLKEQGLEPEQPQP